MKPYKIGLVIGKFYPIHKGHNYLLEKAIQLSETLIIIICQRPDEFPTGDQRFHWMHQLYKKNDKFKSERIFIKLIKDDNFDGEDSLFWADMTLVWCKAFIGEEKIDVVCTSEKYGDNYCKYLGLLSGRRVVHHLVDLRRENVPVSGTKIRARPEDSLHFLRKEVKRQRHFI
jgi:HTH-type transcriptional regulator, transcriptional repressor of NAD biosynthesis genes